MTIHYDAQGELRYDARSLRESIRAARTLSYLSAAYGTPVYVYWWHSARCWQVTSSPYNLGPSHYMVRGDRIFVREYCHKGEYKEIEVSTITGLSQLNGGIPA